MIVLYFREMHTKFWRVKEALFQQCTLNDYEKNLFAPDLQLYFNFEIIFEIKKTFQKF